MEVEPHIPMKVIQCPQCEVELTNSTARVKPVNRDSYKLKCGICHHTWVAVLKDFYDKEPDPAVVMA